MLSAGLLLYRRSEKKFEYFLVHPGGPFWAKKDAGAWSIPKGECEPHEDPLAAAQREFFEETGHRAEGAFTPLPEARLKSGKRIAAWAVEGDLNPDDLRSDHFEIEWPAGSGQMRSFPEVDRAGWFDAAAAREKLNPAQAIFVDDWERRGAEA